MDLKSLRHLSLKKIEQSIEKNLSVDLIKRLNTLPASLQKALCHYLVRSDCRKRALYKEVFNVHACLELIKKINLDCVKPSTDIYLRTKVISYLPVAFSSTAGRIFIITNDLDDSSKARTSHLYVLDLETGQVLFAQNYERRICEIKLSPDGTYFLVGPYLYEVATFKLCRNFEDKPYKQIFFHPGTPDLFYCDGKNIGTFSLSKENDEGHILFDFNKDVHIGYLGFCPSDSNILVAAERYGCNVYFYDMKEERRLRRKVTFNYTGIGTINSIFFDPYGLSLHIYTPHCFLVCDLDLIKKLDVENAYQSKQYDSDCVLIKKSVELEGRRIIAGSATMPYGYALREHSYGEIGPDSLEIYDVYDGTFEAEVEIGRQGYVTIREGLRHKISWKASASFSLNEPGNCIFLFKEYEQQGYFYEIKDFEISLLPLLLLLYIDQRRSIIGEEIQQLPQLLNLLDTQSQLQLHGFLKRPAL